MQSKNTKILAVVDFLSHAEAQSTSYSPEVLEYVLISFVQSLKEYDLTEILAIQPVDPLESKNIKDIKNIAELRDENL